ncbi:hypothetical protein IC229_13055 [Spirosoma sp. BT702]|uniref:Right-handed parallel beta-helix repeat-containing protein n=2 Tax=Spirosoma profusum TaxID=2771354 RepID=A0A926XVZ3_9BACT|nr:hypothetical protein [Spirosoma profusum]
MYERIDMGAFEYQMAGFCNKVVYVTPGGAGMQDGSSWANALSSSFLQEMISTACSSVTFLLGAGLYKPTIGADRSRSFFIPSGVQIYGGYVAGTTTCTTFPSSTTLSGEIADLSTNWDNSNYVVKFKNASSQTRLDGVVITGGSDKLLDTSGGIQNDGSGSGNSSSPSLTNIILIRNDGFYGGGLYNMGRNGGNASPMLTNVLFINNAGGGIYNDGYAGTSSPVLTNVRIEANYGTGMHNDGTEGGTSNPVLTNVCFQGNEHRAIRNIGTNGTCSPLLTNVTILNNTYHSPGVAVYSTASTPRLINCVVFRNKGSQTFYSSNSTLTVEYSLLEPGLTDYTDGGNNITTTISPFVSDNDPQLNACSPAIDAGNNSLNTTLTDLAGNPRRQRTIDMGAFEFQGTTMGMVTIPDGFLG